MKIHQLLTSYSYGDAIGNEALVIRDFLRNRGVESEIFAMAYHQKYAGQVINYKEYDQYSDGDGILIYHFSIGSPVTRKFLSAEDRKVMIYHNITPHHFFLDYHRILAKDCFKGRLELKKFVGKVDLALGDSQYNVDELDEAGFDNTGVLPLVMNFHKFDKPPVPVVDDIFRDDKTNIIYVGRIIPNKKIEDVVKSFAMYQKLFNKDSRLIIVGEYRGFERYHSALMKMVADLEVENIHFTGHVPEDELLTYFKLADIYLHMSEHEGFCAPVPEGFYLNIPVVAFNAGAVKETMNRGGILVNRKEYVNIAGVIDRLVADSVFRQKVLDTQQKALEKYSQNRTGSIMVDYLEKLTGRKI